MVAGEELSQEVTVIIGKALSKTLRSNLGEGSRIPPQSEEEFNTPQGISVPQAVSAAIEKASSHRNKGLRTPEGGDQPKPI